MGCNQSTQQATKQSRERQPTLHPQKTTAPATTASQATPSRPGRGDDGDAQVAMSYSDRRVLEQDYYKDLIARTANKFIDVSQSQTTAVVESHEAQDRAKKYRVDLTTAEPAPLSALLTLPPVAKDVDVGALLASPSALSSADLDLLRDACRRTVEAMQVLKIEPVGDLVVSFTVA